MKCFYHSSDFDGYASGAIIQNRYPECEMIGINYDDEFDLNNINNGEIIFMVDFCLQPFDLMKQLNKKAILIWIDHHKSAIEESKKYNKNIQGVRDINKAGCELTWKFINPDKKMPRGIHLLGRYDVWDNEDKNTFLYQYGLKSCDTGLDSNIWNAILEDNKEVFDRIIKDGKIIGNYAEQENKILANSYAFETKFNGLKCIALNNDHCNSQVFDTIWDNKKYDAMMTFGFKKGQWTVSLYSDRDDIDVSKIAKKHGGGGHKGASGFQTNDINEIIKGYKHES